MLSPETGELSHRTEALLYAADKAEHVDTVVQPALDRGEVVITDRYVDSPLAYQGAGRELAVAEVEAVARWATHGLRPHLTVVLDVDPREGLGRFEGRDRIEARVARVPRAGPAVVPRPGRRRPRPLPRARRAAPGRRDRRPRSTTGSTPLLGQARRWRHRDASSRRLLRPSGTTWSASTGWSRCCGPRPAATA